MPQVRKTERVPEASGLVYVNSFLAGRYERTFTWNPSLPSAGIFSAVNIRSCVSDHKANPNRSGQAPVEGTDGFVSDNSGGVRAGILVGPDHLRRCGVRTGRSFHTGHSRTAGLSEPFRRGPLFSAVRSVSFSMAHTTLLCFWEESNFVQASRSSRISPKSPWALSNLQVLRRSTVVTSGIRMRLGIVVSIHWL